MDWSDLELKELLYKYQTGQCSEDEQKQLEVWYNHYEEEAEILGKVPDNKLEQLFFLIDTKIRRMELKTRRHRLYRWVGSVVAVFIIVLGISLLWPGEQENLTLQYVIVPGQERAFLQLSDGREVSLEDVEKIQERNGCVIRNDSLRILDYRSAGEEMECVYNTLTVPWGGEYSVVLSDGTRVRLNSGSVLKYPVKFGKNDRSVNLSGEGYFDVVHNGTPFIVQTMDMDVQVLGTSFNVSAYPDARRVTTTLITGKVIVCDNRDASEYPMDPGYTFSYFRTSGEVKMSYGDEDVYTSWVKGIFKFRDMRLEDIMLQLNRWYNCQVVYGDEGLKELRFSGAAERDRPIEYLLEMISTVTQIHFNIKDNQVIIRR